MKLNRGSILLAIFLFSAPLPTTGINAQDQRIAGDETAKTQVNQQESAKEKLDKEHQSTKTEHAEQGGESNFTRDREVFHFLLSNHEKITRKVTELENGVETLTESTDAAIAEKIQEHVAAMYKRVENHQPIRMRDPLFREVFKHADQIEMKLENTEHGIRITETSEDEYVVKVIQAHAKVLSKFVEHGFEEAHKNHDAPQR
jgi:hypothetical protein